MTTTRTPAPYLLPGSPLTDLVRGLLRTPGNPPNPAWGLSSYSWDAVLLPLPAPHVKETRAQLLPGPPSR